MPRRISRMYHTCQKLRYLSDYFSARKFDGRRMQVCNTKPISRVLLAYIASSKHPPPSLSLVSLIKKTAEIINQLFSVVIGTGLIGWLLNIILVLCSGPLYVLNLINLDGNSFVL